MNTPRPECPACRITMQEGFIIDVGHGGQHYVPKWAEGAPVKATLGGLKIKGLTQLQTVTFRCPRCGWLIWFAPDAPSTGA